MIPDGSGDTSVKEPIRGARGERRGRPALRCALVAAGLGTAVLGLAQCEDKAKDESPVGVTRRLAQAVAERDSEGAYALLGPETRARLKAAAARANALSGSKPRLAPQEMLSLAWRTEAEPDWKPKTFKLLGVEGNRARVEVSGGAKQERAVVRLVRVKGRWRVELDLPPSPTPSPPGPAPR